MDFEHSEAEKNEIELFAILPFLFSIYTSDCIENEVIQFGDDSDAMRNLY